MRREHFGQSGAAQVFGFLLLNPCAMALRLGLPVPIRAAQVAAAGMPFEHDGAARQCGEEQVERRWMRKLRLRAEASIARIELADD